MLQPPIESALNTQLNEEQTAAQEYLAMAAWFEQRNLKGFASFMRAQFEEESQHALKIFDHIFQRSGQVRLKSIPEPVSNFDSPKTVFQAAYDREKANTKSIHELYRLAGEHDDYATQVMLQWFITEQVEEEQWAEEAIGLLDVAGDNRSAMLMLDARYGTQADKGMA